MNKRELIKKFYIMKQDIEKEMKGVSRDFERYYSVLGAMSEFLDLAEQLNEPAEEEECELIEDRDDWDCLQSLTCSLCNHNVYDNNWRYFKFCPNCGRKIKKGETK